MATVSGTFTAVGLSAVLDVPAVDEEITISLTGTWVATVRLERELSPYSNSWEVIRSDTGNYSIVIKQIRKNERYRFNTVAYTSGTVTFSVADAVLVLTEITDPNTGALLAHYDEDGFVVDGDFDVTGTFTGAGSGIFGTLTVASGSLTDSSGAISFGNENLSTTGTFAAGVSTLDGIAGGDSALGIAGEAAAQGGSVDITGGTSSTAGNAGGAATFTGGTPGSTSAGGAATIAAGAGGSSSGAGGVASLVGGAATAGNSAGGEAFMDGGAGQGTSAGGACNITSGASEDGTSGVNPGASGAATLESGAAGTTDTGTAGASGALVVRSAAGGAATGAAGIGGASGTLAISTGDGGAASDSDSGNAGNAGDMTITGGTGGAGTSLDGGDGADITITGGLGGAAAASGDDGGEGGNVSLIGGAGGADGEGSAGVGAKGGDIVVTGGAGGLGSTGEDGGDVTITTGAAVGSGQAGTLRLDPILACVLENILVVADTGGTTTMTAAVATSVVHAKDPAASITYTTPTGTLLRDHFASQPAAGDSFLWSLVNTGNTTGEDIALAAGSNTTMVGDLIVHPAADTIEGQIASATWRVVNDAGGIAWTWYRVA